ncbi:pentatricopeptide repeat-containing protein [Dorcoceras hygrometricum]|uniref:Pentatricopeptide repeat-containing protein n=1 Tax=Dorcoceras hygrometricum TaxID=472368 RepID=A0A2Z6ZUI8_9LAMI|nr:pentatricopeptide repeat-containing protein [Dorcoceras hygrometricum]
MRLHKLIRQRFAHAIKIQQMLFALITSRKIQSQATVDPVARFIQSTRYDGSSRELQYYASSRKDPRKADVAKHCNQAQNIQSTKISAEDEFSRSDKPAAKQLTIYEELSKLDVNC